jgi:hypothetical protein
MYETTYGSKYDKSLSKTEIAKRIRADLKAAMADGTIPEMAASVRKTSHNSIRVELSACPFEVLSEARVLADRDNPYQFRGDLPWMSEEGRLVQDAVEKIAGAYNFDGSDIQSDYFHVNYYLTVEFDHGMRETERAMILVRNGRSEAA